MYLKIILSSLWYFSIILLILEKFLKINWLTPSALITNSLLPSMSKITESYWITVDPSSASLNSVPVGKIWVSVPSDSKVCFEIWVNFTSGWLQPLKCGVEHLSNLIFAALIITGKSTKHKKEFKEIIATSRLSRETVPTKLWI